MCCTLCNLHGIPVLQIPQLCPAGRRRPGQARALHTLQSMALHACRKLFPGTGPQPGTVWRAGHAHASAKMDCALTASDAYVLCGSEDGAPTHPSMWKLGAASLACTAPQCSGLVTWPRPDVLGERQGVCAPLKEG